MAKHASQIDRAPEGVDLAEIRRLRCEGRTRAALDGLRDRLRAHSGQTAALAEAVKLFVLCGKPESAYRAYARLRALPDACEQWEPEYLARLQLVSGQDVPEWHTCEAEATARWFRTWRESGDDPVYAVQVVDLEILCDDGPIDYHLTVTCDSCGSRYLEEIHRTLLVYRRFFCPVCFARQTLEAEEVRKFLLQSYDTNRLQELDEPVFGLQRRLYEAAAEPNPDVPWLCLALNQDYIFWLNRVLLAELKR